MSHRRAGRRPNSAGGLRMRCNAWLSGGAHDHGLVGSYLLLCCLYADQLQTRAQLSCAERSCRRGGAWSHTVFLVLDLKGRAFLWPPAAAVIHVVEISACP